MTASIVTNSTDINGAGGDLVFTEPSGVVAGNMLAAHLLNFNSGGTPLDPGLISTFTDIFNNAASGGLNSQNDRACYKVAAAAGGPHTSTIGASSSFSSGIMLRIGGCHPTTPLDAAVGSVGDAASSTALPAATSVANDCLAVCFVTAQNAAFTALPTGWTLYLRYDSDFSAVYTKSVGAPGTSTGTATQTFSAATDFSIVVFTVAPLPVAPPLPRRRNRLLLR